MKQRKGEKSDQRTGTLGKRKGENRVNSKKFTVDIYCRSDHKKLNGIIVYTEWL